MRNFTRWFYGPADRPDGPQKAYADLMREIIYHHSTSYQRASGCGVNIKRVVPFGNVTAAGSRNAMCTHRIKIEGEKGINKDLINWIKQAYDQAE